MPRFIIYEHGNKISKNPSFKQFLEENHAYGRYVKNVTNQILRNGDIS